MPPHKAMTSHAPDSLVVFIDMGMMLSFDQLASALRQLGVRVVHISSATNPLARLSSRVLYDEGHRFSSTDDLVAVLASLDRDRILDIQCPEFILAEVLEASRRAGLTERVLRMLEERLLWCDKFEVCRRLEAASIPAPRTRQLMGATHQAVVEELGSPFMVKTRVGSGGEGVRMVESGSEYASSVAELGGPGAELYAEEFLPGETLCYAAAFVDGHSVESTVYRTVLGPRTHGPSSHIEVVRDQAVRGIGERVVGLLQGTGLVNLDLVRAADGQPKVVDVNLRAWHSVAALAAVNHTFAHSYLNGLLGQDQPPVGPGLTGQVHVFPDQGPLAAGRIRAAREFLADAWGQRRVLPPRYIAMQTLLFIRRLMREGGASRV
ncbi:ATP-grasp domain-containing protein [Luteococcus sp. Sow4_B9]|uniref:ATP-grasp domain-containing protein n=1 Tax=Luteococcus sp. Sow4_B9 TaxID=3438792 RepID=UPI003F9BE2F9